MPPEQVAFISNGVELPELAVYNKELQQPIILVCTGGEESRDLQIDIVQTESSHTLPHGVHFITEEGLTVIVQEFDNVIEVSISIDDLISSLGVNCSSQQSQAYAHYVVTTGTLLSLCSFVFSHLQFKNVFKTNSN